MSNTALHERSCCGIEPLLVRRTTRGGATVICFQCLQCGRQNGNPIPRVGVAEWESLPEFDPAIAEAAWEKRMSESRQCFENAERERLLYQEERLRKYADYINSAEWSRKRSRVMMRARQGAAFPMCEGCGDRPATEVHHLTYQNLGEEFLWELAAVCDHCHERLHHTNAANEA